MNRGPGRISRQDGPLAAALPVPRLRAGRAGESAGAPRVPERSGSLSWNGM